MAAVQEDLLKQGSPSYAFNIMMFLLSLRLSVSSLGYWRKDSPPGVDSYRCQKRKHQSERIMSVYRSPMLEGDMPNIWPWHWNSPYERRRFKCQVAETMSSNTMVWNCQGFTPATVPYCLFRPFDRSHFGEDKISKGLSKLIQYKHKLIRAM